MPAIANVFRRGAVYYWRRRLPPNRLPLVKSSNLVVNLMTKDQERARPIAALVAARFHSLLQSPMRLSITDDELRQIFALTVKEASADLDRRVIELRFDSDMPGPDVQEWMCKVEAAALAIRAARGDAARFNDGIRAFLENEKKFSREAVELVEDRLNQYAMEPPEADLRVEASDHLKRLGVEATDANVGLAINMILRGWAAAYEITDERCQGRYFADADLARSVLKATPREFSPHPATPTPAPVAAAALPAVIEDSAPASENIAIADRSDPRHPIIVLGEGVIEDRAEVWDVKTARQARSIFDLLARYLAERGIHTLAALRQPHLAEFRSFLREIPKSYGKAQADFSRSCRELAERGRALPAAARGISATTINRHFSFITALMDFIAAQGHAIDPLIKPKALRVKTRERGRDKRAAFSDADIQGLFRLPPFVGCADWTRAGSFQAGGKLFHRALYWAPILLYYTGARREEICGLEMDDVIVDEIPHIVLRPTGTRRVKNESSRRLLPLHPELLRLGFLDYVAAVRKLGYNLVFPDLYSPTSSSLLGDRLYDDLISGIKEVTGSAGSARKAIHSLRHTCGAALKKARVHSEDRADILGHSGRSVTEEIYAEETELAVKAGIIGQLPVATAHLKSVPIRLLAWVQARQTAPFSRPDRTKAARADKIAFAAAKAHG